MCSLFTGGSHCASLTVHHSFHLTSARSYRTPCAMNNSGPLSHSSHCSPAAGDAVMKACRNLLLNTQGGRRPEGANEWGRGCERRRRVAAGKWRRKRELFYFYEKQKGTKTKNMTKLQSQRGLKKLLRGKMGRMKNRTSNRRIWIGTTRRQMG